MHDPSPRRTSKSHQRGLVSLPNPREERLLACSFSSFYPYQTSPNPIPHKPPPSLPETPQPRHQQITRPSPAISCRNNQLSLPLPNTSQPRTTGLPPPIPTNQPNQANPPSPLHFPQPPPHHHHHRNQAQRKPPTPLLIVHRTPSLTLSKGCKSRCFDGGVIDRSRSTGVRVELRGFGGWLSPPAAAPGR